MKIICKGRGRGKTYELICISNEKQIPIITATQFEADRIANVANDLGIDIPRPVSISSFVAEERYPMEILVDEAFDCLAAILKCDIDAITIPKEKVPMDIFVREKKEVSHVDKLDVEGRLKNLEKRVKTLELLEKC